MQVKHLDHLNLSVASLAESVDWYGRVFGFGKVEEGDYEGVPWAIVRSGEAMLCMYQYTRHSFEAPDARAGRGVHGINHFGLRITDRDDWLATVERERVEVQYGGPVRWPHATAWYVLDPTGYEIEVALWDDDTITFE